MNVTALKTTLGQKVGRTSLYLQKHSPEILLITGLGGMLATVVLAVKAAKKDTVAETHKSDMKNFDHFVAANNLSKEQELQGKAALYVQTGLEYGKLYGPAVIVGSLSLAAILGSHGIMTKRQVALVGAYNLAIEAYNAYRSRVVEEFGEVKDRQFHLGIYEDEYTVKEENEEGKKVKTTKKVLSYGPGYKAPSIYSRFFDKMNPNWCSDRTLNKSFLIGKQNYLNDLLTLRGHVFLNEVYEALGFPHTKEGQLVGWVKKSTEEMEAEKRDGFIDFGLFDEDGSDANREFINLTNDAVLLDFNPDGIMFQEI